MYKVYLAGPISKCSYEQCTQWREYVTNELEIDYVCLSPMRGKEFLKGQILIQGDYKNNLMGSAKSLTSRDRFDIQRCDVVLMNLLEADFVSIGTMIEIGQADILRIPLVVVMKAGSVYDHPMITEIASVVVETLDDGIRAVESFLGEK